MSVDRERIEAMTARDMRGGKEGRSSCASTDVRDLLAALAAAEAENARLREALELADCCCSVGAVDCYRCTALASRPGEEAAS